MFENLIENYKLMSKSDKRQEIINELKLMIAVFDKMCEEKGINSINIQSREILDLKNGEEPEDDFLEATFVYVEYLKEILGSLFNS